MKAKKRRNKIKPEYVYVVRCYKIDLKSTTERVVRERTWGFYKSLSRARRCVTENWTDIFEANYYNYAVIMKMPQGVCVHPKKNEWYEIKYGKTSKSFKVKKVNFDPINVNRGENSRMKYFISW